MYLFSEEVGGSDEAVALADDGRVLAAANGVHEPMGVVIVDDVEEAPSAPRHPLHQSLPEVIERHRHLHHLVPLVAIARPKQHHLFYIHAPTKTKQKLNVLIDAIIFVYVSNLYDLIKIILK